MGTDTHTKITEENLVFVLYMKLTTLFLSGTTPMLTPAF